jgi:hypothetical protein
MAMNEQQPEMHRDVMYERRDINARVILFVVIGIVLAGFVIREAVKWSYGYFSQTEFRGAQPVTLVKQTRPAIPGPQLQVNPAVDLERLRRSDKQILDSYGWVDRQNGIVRIPIDEAMKLVLQRGLPPAAKSSPTPTGGAQKR